METKKKITAICGWAVPSAWFKKTIEMFFPKYDVKAFYPTSPKSSDEAEKILQKTKSDLYIGYSLGSLWLMYHSKLIPNNAIKALIAPILSFVKEDKKGGKTSSIQLLYLIKNLKLHPEDSKPIIDFFTKCNLSNGETLLGDIPKNNILLEGLKFLRDIKVSETLSRDFLSYLGDKDPFIGKQLKQYIPHLEIVVDCNHSPEKMLNALAKHLKSKV